MLGKWRATHRVALCWYRLNGKNNKSERVSVGQWWCSKIALRILLSSPFYVFSAARRYTSIRGKLHSWGKYFIFKLGNNLFKFISLRYEHKMQRQYFISEKLCKETGGLVHVSKVHICNNVSLKGWAALSLLPCDVCSHPLCQWGCGYKKKKEAAMALTANDFWLSSNQVWCG